MQPLGILTAGISAIVLLSAAVALGVGAFATPHPYFMLGFEVVILIAAAFGVLIGMGRFSEGPAIALACVAGTIGIGSLLGYLGAGRQLGSVNLTPFLYARGAAAGVLALLAAVTVLKRHPGQSLPALVRGAASGVAFAVVIGGLYLIRAQVIAYGPLAKIAMVIIGGIVGLGLFAAMTHYTIKAFEAGRIRTNGSAA